LELASSTLPTATGDACMYVNTATRLLAEIVATLNLSLRGLLTLFLLGRLLPFGCLLLLNCRGRRVNGYLSCIRRNALQGPGSRDVAGHDEPFCRNAAAAFDGVAMFDVPGLPRSQLDLLAAVQPNFQAAPVIDPGDGCKISCPDIQLLVIPSDADSLTLRDGLLFRAVNLGIVGRGLQAGWAVGNKISLAGPDHDEVAAGIYRFNGTLSLWEQTVLRTSLATVRTSLFGASRPASAPAWELQDFHGAIYVQDDIRLTQKLTVKHRHAL
jgi:hypothetical protein